MPGPDSARCGANRWAQHRRQVLRLCSAVPLAARLGLFPYGFEVQVMVAFLRAWWLRIVIGLAVLLVAIQFIPYGVDNPKTNDEPKWDSARTRELFVTACADCHSNNTNVLWFEHVAPIKWYVANHVKEGRGALNISEWHTAAGGDVDEMTETIEEGSMPPDFYTYFGLHSDSKLTPAEKQQLIDGIRATMAADPPVGGE